MIYQTKAFEVFSLSQLFLFEKPLGMRDRLPHQHHLQNKISTQLLKTIGEWGYEKVQTPALEYFETVGKLSAIPDQQLFKCFDLSGNTLVLRPDMTAPIARLVSSTMKKESFPLRLSYHSNLYRAQQLEGGRPAEFEQVGVELIGDATTSGDSEIVVLFQEAMQTIGLEKYQLVLGHIGFIRALLNELVPGEQAEQLQRSLFEKNDVGYREAVHTYELPLDIENRLIQLLELRGDAHVVDEAEQLVTSDEGKKAIDELRGIWDVLQEEGIESFVQFDLSTVLHMSYYTGFVFEAFHEDVAQALGGGGRYDQLLKKFGRTAPATGFGLRVDLLSEVYSRENEPDQKWCVLYHHSRRKEAYSKAAELRQSGKAVIVQDQAGLSENWMNEQVELAYIHLEEE